MKLIFKHSKSVDFKSRPSNGFALVVALSLMSFILLLLLSLVSFVRVGGMEANTQMQGLIARQNALLGVQIALGTLQGEMGPDQRISASSALLDANAETRVVDNVNEARWTGSYDSEQWNVTRRSVDPLPDFKNRNRLRRWLVSQDDKEGVPEYDPETFGANSGDNSVVIVGEGTVGSRSDLPGESVRVPALELEGYDFQSSKFAWWVGDEGQKANLNPPTNRNLSGFIEDVFSLSANHRAALRTVHSQGEDVFPERDFTNVKVETDVEKRLVGRSTLPQSILDEGGNRLPAGDVRAELIDEAYHDFTVYSRGVLSDVQDGGLKKDLNLLFANTSLPREYRDEPIFETSSNGVDLSPTWDLLHRHYNWFNGLRVTGSNQTTSINDRMYLDSRGRGRRLFDYEEDDLKYFLQPVVTKVQYIFGLFAQESPRRLAVEGHPNSLAPNPQLLHLMCYPVVTLWNPYNVSIRTDKIMWDLYTPPLELTWNIGGQKHTISLAEAFTMPKFEWSVNAFRLRNGGNAAGVGRVIDIWTKKETGKPALELKPGETRVYTPEFIELENARQRHLHADSYDYTGKDALGRDVYKEDFFNFGLDGSYKYRKGVSFDMIPGWNEPGKVTANQYNIGMYTDILSRENYLNMETILPGIGPFKDQFQGYAPIIYTSGGFNTLTVDIMENQPKLPHGLTFFIENGIQQYERLTREKQLRDSDADNWVHYLGEIGIRCSMDAMRSMFKGLKRSFTMDIPIPGTLDNPAPLFVVNFKLKNLDDPANPMPYSLYGDVTDNFQRIDALNDESALALFNYEFEFFDIRTWSDSPLVEIDSNNNGFIATGDTAFSGVSFHTMREVPTAPLLSLGQLQHAPLGRDYTAPRYEPSRSNISVQFERYNMPNVSIGASRSGKPSRFDTRSDLGNGATFAYAFGNSMAHPMVDPDIVLDGSQADTSYLLNDALWDGYFCSSIVPTSIRINRRGKSSGRVLEAAADGSEPLPNPAMEEVEDGVLSTVVRELTRGSDAYKRAAEYLMVRGAFNVNSTSVEAWAALLGGAFGRSVSTLVPIVGVNKLSDNELSQVSSNAMNGVPFSRFTVPNNDTPLDSYSDKGAPRAEQAAWNGFRVLSENQINSLAEAIVEQVKKRGPFLSLSEFVNRQPSDDNELAISGAIQSAIDSLDEKGDFINAELSGSDQRMSNDVASQFAFPEAASQPLAKGSPGWLMQADVLTPLAPLLSARSDTFVLRGYGEFEGAGGDTTAICEMVVQRTPEYVYASANDPTDEPSELSDLNRTFGRRFKVVDFRWVNTP